MLPVMERVRRFEIKWPVAIWLGLAVLLTYGAGYLMDNVLFGTMVEKQRDVPWAQTVTLLGIVGSAVELGVALTCWKSLQKDKWVPALMLLWSVGLIAIWVNTAQVAQIIGRVLPGAIR